MKIKTVLLIVVSLLLLGAPEAVAQVKRMTWGDAPEGFTAIDHFYALGLHKAAGFVNP